MFKISVKINIGTEREYTAFVAIERNGVPTTWDGSWYTTNELNKVKTWKTRRGAENWLNQRTIIRDKMGAAIEAAH